MRLLYRAATCTILTFVLASCGLVYHPPLQQGNLVDKDTVKKLETGMSKRQVQVLMGSPSIDAPYASNRWDYVHAFANNGHDPEIRQLTLYFKNGQLARTEGGLYKTDNKHLLKQAQMYDKAGTESDNDKGPRGDKAPTGDQGSGGNDKPQPGQGTPGTPH